jgi:UDP-N-acetylglucosamine 1-carboxyvinyltransferase
VSAIAPYPQVLTGMLMTRARPQDYFVIEGGGPISGRVRPEGNKNAALPLLAATLLTAEPVELSNVPRIRDVETMLELLDDLGAEVAWIGPNEVRVCAADVSTTALDERLAERIRASILLAGPLLGRFGRAEVPPPGGDVIGRRRVDTHLFALAGLGAIVEVERAYKFWAPGGLRGAELFLDEASVTGTENALMAAALAEGRTTIVNAACEPHVQELCELLQSMGSHIEGIGSNLLHIDGCRELGGARHRVRADHIEIGSFIGLAAVTGGDLVIEDAEPRDLRATLHAFERLGVHCDPLPDGSLHVPANQELAIQDDVGGQIAKIEDGPWPMFPADLTSIAVAVATQAMGTVLVFEKLFENRLVFTDKLVNMGARIILCDPHRVVVTGPAKLYGQRLSSPDIRAGMALLIASLAAEGTSVIGEVGQIDRGYERIDERLRALGARIERVTA